MSLPCSGSSMATPRSSACWVVTGGRLADRFGRRRAFFDGAAIFALFSIIGGFAPSISLLLACRFRMGVGGAMIWLAILGMTYSLLPPSKAGLAGGIILGAAGFGNAMGPLLGGLLTDTLGWRWIFFLNLLVAAAAVMITLLVVPDHAPRTDHGKIDYLGTAVLSIGLLALLLALDWALDLDWTAPRIVFLFGLAVVALVGFLFIERRAADSALVPRICPRQPALSRRWNCHPAGVGHLLRRAAVPAAVHVEGARL